MLRLARLALRRPVLWLAGTLLLTSIFASGLSRLEVRTDGAALHPPANPTVLRSQRDRELFHDPEVVILLVSERPDGPALRSPAGFSFLRDLDAAVRRMPGVRSSGVRSLANLTEMRVSRDSIAAVPYLDEVPGDPAAFDDLVRRLRAHPLADGTLLSASGKSAALYVPIVEGEDRRAWLAALDPFLATQRRAGFELEMTGPVAAESLLGDMVLQDLARLIPAMVVVIFVLLWLQTRTVAGLLLPLVEVLLVLVWTLGAMGLAGVPMTLVTTLLPVLLMSIAITDEIHLLERIQDRLSPVLASLPQGADRRSALRDSLLASLGEIERPVQAASVTTAIGFFAFPFTSVVPLQHFGLFSTFGFLVAMALSFTAVPAFAVLLPPRFFIPRRRPDTRPESGRLLPYEAFAARFPRRSLLAGTCLVAIAVPGLARLRVEDNWIANFDPGSPLVRAERRFNAELWGTYRFDIVLSGRPGLFYEPGGISLMEQVAVIAGGAPGVSGVLTHLVPAGVVATAFGEAGPLSALPAGRSADYLTLARMSEDPFGLSYFVTADGASARARLFLKSEDYRRDLALAEHLDDRLRPLLAERGVRHHFSGDIPIGIEMVRVIVADQLRSILLTFLAITAFLMLTERPRGRAALLVMLPVCAATLMVFAGMGYTGVSLGIATSMFASLALGVGVDFGLHFLHTYRQQRPRCSEESAALAATLRTAGKALRWSAVVLALGFLVLALSSVRPNHSLGVLLAAAMAGSYAMTLLFLPALVGRVEGRRDAEPEAGLGRPVEPGRLSDVAPG